VVSRCKWEVEGRVSRTFTSRAPRPHVLASGHCGQRSFRKRAPIAGSSVAGRDNHCYSLNDWKVRLRTRGIRTLTVRCRPFTHGQVHARTHAPWTLPFSASSRDWPGQCMSCRRSRQLDGAISAEFSDTSGIWTNERKKLRAIFNRHEATRATCNPRPIRLQLWLCTVQLQRTCCVGPCSSRKLRQNRFTFWLTQTGQTTDRQTDSLQKLGPKRRNKKM